MDAPEPEWKYLSGLAIKKGASDMGPKGALANLLAPRTGAITHVTAPPQIPEASLTNQQHDEPALEPFDEATDDAPPTPPHTPPPTPHPPPPPPPMETVPPVAQQEHQQLTGPSLPAARQTRIGRRVRNTPRYEQSITQQKKGLVAWEVLLNQDEQERVPTAAAQYKIQNCSKTHSSSLPLTTQTSYTGIRP